MKIGEAMYKNSDSEGEKKDDENVVDAEFKEKDGKEGDDKKKE